MTKEEREKIDEEVQKMEDFLTEQEISDDPNQWAWRLTVLNAYMARSGSLLALAKYDQDKQIAEVFIREQKLVSKLPATVATKYVSAMCFDENLLVNRLDRINRDCVHQSDNIRTMISFAKQQMSLEGPATSSKRVK